MPTLPLADRHDRDGSANGARFDAARLLPRFAENPARALDPDPALQGPKRQRHLA